jgi:hypothetical protein
MDRGETVFTPRRPRRSVGPAKDVVAVWAGIIFTVVALTLVLLAMFMNSTFHRPRLRGGPKPHDRPIVGWANDSDLPRL